MPAPRITKHSCPAKTALLNPPERESAISAMRCPRAISSEANASAGEKRPPAPPPRRTRGLTRGPRRPRPPPPRQSPPAPRDPALARSGPEQSGIAERLERRRHLIGIAGIRMQEPLHAALHVRKQRVGADRGRAQPCHPDANQGEVEPRHVELRKEYRGDDG